MSPGLGRLLAAALASGGLAVVAASCSDSPSASTPIVTIRPSSYAVQDPPTTTLPPVDTGPTEEGRSPVEQSYTVEEGDNPSQIAQLYEIELEVLRNYNGWASDYSDFPGVGDTVRIPPDAKFIDPNATTTSDPDSTEATDGTSEADGTSEPAETIGEGGRDDDCVAGTYTIEEGDNPSLIAANFDVTLEALTEANGWASDYSDFPRAGETITIPPATTCDTTG